MTSTTAYDPKRFADFPKKYPIEINASDQMNDATNMSVAKSGRDIFPSPAGIGTKTFIAGRSFPIKINHAPFF